MHSGAMETGVTTTAIFAEVLIAGLEGLAWILIPLAAAFGISASAFSGLKDWEALVTVSALAGAYAWGTVTDRLADSVFGRLHKARKRDMETDYGVTSGAARLAVLEKSDAMVAYLDYGVSRARVARDTAFCAGCMAVWSGALAVALRVTGRAATSPQGLWACLLGALVVLTASWWAQGRIASAYHDRLVEAYCLVTGMSEKIAPVVGRPDIGDQRREG